MTLVTINAIEPVSIAVTDASGIVAVAAKTERGPRLRHYINVGANTCWLAIGGATATAVDTAGWIKLIPGAFWLDEPDKKASTVICAAGLSTRLSVNGWG